MSHDACARYLGTDVYLDRGMCGFIAKQSIKNMWRVQQWMDLDDLIEDGFLCFFKCRRRYAEFDKPEPTSDDRRQMMALVRTTFSRHIIDLSNQRTEQAPEQCESQFGERDDGASVVESIAGESELSACASALAGAPREVVELFALLVRDAVDAAKFARDTAGRRETVAEHLSRLKAGAGLRFRRSRIRDVDGRLRLGRRAVRETTNQFYCRLLGLDPREHDVRQMVKDYLS